jgi:hypothetical protein
MAYKRYKRNLPVLCRRQGLAHYRMLDLMSPAGCFSFWFFLVRDVALEDAKASNRAATVK